MPMRFLIETPVSLDAVVTLDAERSHYLCKVMRMTSGASVTCFDGEGTSFRALLIQANAKKSVLQITAIDPTDTPATAGLYLGMSVLKGPAMDRALQQATELGAAGISLVTAQRSNVILHDNRLQNKMTHWRKIIAGACEQSGRLFVPALDGPVALDTLLHTTTHKPMIFDLEGTPLPAALPQESRLLMIGPEGGWDETERRLFMQRKLGSYSLGANTLRAETTPAVALTLVRHLQTV